MSYSKKQSRKKLPPTEDHHTFFTFLSNGNLTLKKIVVGISETPMNSMAGVTLVKTPVEKTVFFRQVPGMRYGTVQVNDPAIAEAMYNDVRCGEIFHYGNNPDAIFKKQTPQRVLLEADAAYYGVTNFDDTTTDVQLKRLIETKKSLLVDKLKIDLNTAVGHSIIPIPEASKRTVDTTKE